MNYQHFFLALLKNLTLCFFVSLLNAPPPGLTKQVGEQEEPLMHKTSRHCRLFLSGDEADTSWASKYTPPLVAPKNSKFRLQNILHPSPPLRIKILEYTLNFQHTSPISFYCSGIATWQILQQEMKQTPGECPNIPHPSSHLPFEPPCHFRLIFCISGVEFLNKLTDQRSKSIDDTKIDERYETLSTKKLALSRLDYLSMKLRVTLSPQFVSGLSEDWEYKSELVIFEKVQDPIFLRRRPSGYCWWNGLSLYCHITHTRASRAS